MRFLGLDLAMDFLYPIKCSAWKQSSGPNANHGLSMGSAADISAALRSLVKYLGALLTAGDHKVAGGFGVPAFSLGDRS